MDTTNMTKRWYDDLMLVLGVWLFLSPWVLSYSLGATESWNAYIAGAAIAAVAAFTVYRPDLWGEVINLVIGIWVVVSPWALKVAAEQTARVNALVVGAIVVLLALWGLWHDPNFTKHLPGHGAAS